MSDEVQRSLGRIEGKLGEVKDLLTVHLADDTKRFSDIGDRLGRVERKTYASAGVVSIITAFITAKLTGH